MFQIFAPNVHLPGCLPDAGNDGPPIVFRDASEAWRWLRNDRLRAFADAESVATPDDLALAAIDTMIATPAHNAYGTTQGPDPVNPDMILCYSVDPLPIRDFLSNYTVQAAMEAFREQYDAWYEDPGLHRMSADDVHTLLMTKAAEEEVYRAAQDAAVDIGLAHTNVTIYDVLLSEVFDHIAHDGNDYLNTKDEVVEILVEALLDHEGIDVDDFDYDHTV